MGPYNQDAWRMVENKVNDTIDAKITAADINGKAEAAVAVFIKGKADTLPAAADFVGQMFIKTGNTNPGLYVATGTTTPAWKAVELAS